MTPANDNTPLGADAVIEQRPSPDELNRILHRRFPGMGPAYGRQLDEAARKTFNADFSKWLGLDNRWHPCGEKYRQPKGSRRLAKPSKPVRPVLLEHDQDVGAPWSRWSPAVAEGAEFLAGRTVPAVGGRLLQIGAEEDKLIAMLDAAADTWAEVPHKPKRGRPPRKATVAANDNTPVRRQAA
ncbi:hypothetical protein IVB34_22110 [Bradyrhizobium sp. 2]|uniref:hypothetical protein n=1 Tax=unclassified Bradyrhizobium TaxID=2631580 RepID=UPI001FF7B706|nr:MULTISPECIES: hypothetical protein [unclassified Bradyrhizobium]MCK1445872.1 hypothetical protein [Bradyrhizobium sp. 48]MCK1460981.1 hypothetical protein [Bradyrhizobium sp. 2]